MKYITDFKHELVVPIEYHKQGEHTQAKFITVKAPSGKIQSYTSILKQEHSKAMLNVAKQFEGKYKKEDNSKQSETKPSDIIMVISAYGDLQKCYEALRNILLFRTGDYYTCLIDGKEDMTQPLYDSLSITDIDEILGKYLINFLGFSQMN